jgi:hypothetical protein
VGFSRPAPLRKEKEYMSNMRCKHGLIEGQCGICQATLARMCKPKEEVQQEKKKPARKAKSSSE